MSDLNVPVIDKSAISSSSSNTSSYSNSSSNNRQKAKPTQWKGFEVEHQALIQRLSVTGYSTIALSHVIYGNERPCWNAETVIPESLVSALVEKACNTTNTAVPVPVSAVHSRNRHDQGEAVSVGKKRKRRGNASIVDSYSTECEHGHYAQCRDRRRGRPIRILRRLNVIIEQESDLVYYTYNADPKVKDILLSFDLIALSPRNDAVLSAICKSQNLFFCDIVMLDYTAGRGNVQLPFKLKPAHVSAATERGLALELDYAPALLDASKRKAFVQASRQLLNASLGVCKPKPRVIVCSGNRVLDGMDYSSMALRSCWDMMNFCEVVLGFQPELASKVFQDHAMFVMERGQNRKQGKMSNRDGLTFVAIMEEDDDGPQKDPRVVDGPHTDPGVDDVDSTDNGCSKLVKMQGGETNSTRVHGRNIHDNHTGFQEKKDQHASSDDKDDDGFLQLS